MPLPSQIAPWAAGLPSRILLELKAGTVSVLVNAVEWHLPRWIVENPAVPVARAWPPRRASDVLQHVAVARTLSPETASPYFPTP